MGARTVIARALRLSRRRRRSFIAVSLRESSSWLFESRYELRGDASRIQVHSDSSIFDVFEMIRSGESPNHSVSIVALLAVRSRRSVIAESIHSVPI